MRVAAISDVHGNLPALEAVLAEIDAEGVDAIVCGGDLVGGPFSVEVFDRLASMPHVRFVRGNADRQVLEGTDEYGIDWEVERERLGDARLAPITTWPLTVELDVDALGRTLFCHAIPSADEPSSRGSRPTMPSSICSVTSRPIFSSADTRTSSSTTCCPRDCAS